jgi:hypothetical protein
MKKDSISKIENLRKTHDSDIVYDKQLVNMVTTM